MTEDPAVPRRKMAVAEGIGGMWHWLASFYGDKEPFAVGTEHTRRQAVKAACAACDEEREVRIKVFRSALRT